MIHFSLGGATMSGGIWNRACPWCGRGGNLHLDSADPNCRCQQDSVLVNLTVGQNNLGNPSLTTAPVTSLKKAKGNHIKSGGKKKSRKAISTTPTRQLILVADDEELSSATCTPRPENTSRRSSPVRPSSAHSTVAAEEGGQRSRPHKTRKSTSMGSHPPDSVFNPSSNYHSYNQHPYQQQPDPTYQSKGQTYRSVGLSTTSNNWQSLVSSQQQQQYYSPLHPFNLNQPHLRVHQPSRGLQGCMYTNRPKLALSQKSAPSLSMMKLWPNIAYHPETDQWLSPLHVVSQRRIPRK